jgi:hypothetical protein
MVVIMKSFIFWDIMVYSPLEVSGRFGGTFHLHLQGQRMSQAMCFMLVSFLAYSFILKILHAGFFLGSLFDPEDGGDMFHQKIS